MLKKQTPLLLCVAFLFGVFLWIYSDPLPHGHPWREANFVQWRLHDISFKLKSFQMDFWNPTLYGGVSLYSSGLYPIFSPLNILLYFFSPDDLFFWMNIIPYSVAFFFTGLILSKIFRVSLVYAVFGAFYYMGGGLGRYSFTLEDPRWLIGCAIFPIMIYVYYRLSQKNIMRAGAAVGALISLNFGLTGATQMSPFLVWWSFFLLAGVLISLLKGVDIKGFGRAALGGFYLIFFSVGIYAVQIVPTYLFAFSESNRKAGQYDMCSFPFWRCGENLMKNQDSLLNFMIQGFLTNPMGTSMKGIAVLFFISIGVWLVNAKELRKRVPQAQFLGQIALGCFLYIAVPCALGGLALLFPDLKRYFSFFTQFNLSYGVQIFDFLIAIFIGITLQAIDGIPLLSSVKSFFKKNILVILVGLGFLNVFLTFLFIFPAFGKTLLSLSPSFGIFAGPSRTTTFIVFLISCIILYKFIFNDQSKSLRWLVMLALPFLGFMTCITSYNWNDKGRQNYLEDYHFGSPEHLFYSHAAGQYYYDYGVPEYMQQEYNLVYRLHGKFNYNVFPIGPRRFGDFVYSYNHDVDPPKGHFGIQFKLNYPQEAFTTHFPVDFATVKKGENLPWSNFHKELKGDHFDIWVSNVKPHKVRFARQLKVLAFLDVIRRFKEPFDGILYVAESDAEDFGLKETSFSAVKAVYKDYAQKRGDHIQFKVLSPSDVFVIVPQNYQKGWTLYIDGKPSHLFPAQHIFMGFFLPAGEHAVDLKFSTPGLVAGFWGSVLSIIMFFVVMLVPGNGRNQKKDAGNE